MRPIAIFFHVFPWKKYQDIVDETCQLVEDSGLSSASCYMFFCIVRVKGAHPSQINCRHLIDTRGETKLERVVLSVEHKGREWETLKVLWNFCRTVTEPWFVLYIHTKGVYRASPRSDDWRRMMLYFCVERWRETLSMFDDSTCLAVGCNLRNKRPGRRYLENFKSHGLDILKTPPLWHYSGNFWWAKSEAICSLPDPESQDARRILTWKGIKANLAAERWIGELGREHLGMIHKSGVDHYTKRYPRSRYVLEG